MPKKLNIVVEKNPEFAGDKLIKVDGVLWGKITGWRRGVHGVRYTFTQEGGSRITRKHKYQQRSYRTAGKLIERERFVDVEVWSDKHYAHGRNGDDPLSKLPLEQRLITVVESLIKEGLLVHPDVVAARKKEASEKFAATQKKHAQEKRKKFEDKARDIVTDFNAETAMISAIADALQSAANGGLD